MTGADRTYGLYRAAAQDGYDAATASSGQLHNDATGKTGPFSVRVAEITEKEMPAAIVLVFGVGSIEQRFELHVGQGKGRGSHYREVLGS